MKKWMAWLLTLSLAATFAPGVCAAEAEEDAPTFSIQDTEYTYTQDASGKGWSYDADTTTFTMKGLKVGDSEAGDYQRLSFEEAPEGFQINLADRTVNQIAMLNTPYKRDTVISGGGSLDLGSCSGSGMIVESGTISAGYIYCDLVVNGGTVQCNGGHYGDTLDVTGGEVTLGWTKALSMAHVSGGTLNVSELDTYAFRMTGGTVNAGGMSNCNGTSTSRMQYELSGGTFTLGDDDPESRFFLCVTYHSGIQDFRSRLSAFANQLKDENGDPLTIKYFYYGEDGEMLENPSASYNGYMVAQMYNQDGSPATYAKADLSDPCQHEESYIRATVEGHCVVCGLCGGDTEEMQTHDYVAYGSVKFCDCGVLDPEVEYDEEFDVLYPEDVTEEVAQLGLKMWLGLFPMADVMRGTLDPNWNGWIHLEDVARLQLMAQGVEVPETFTALGMSYRADGKAMRVISEPEDLKGDWDAVKVFVLDSETYAPLTQPITIEK